jgi:DNA-binding NtrC family response regulator
MAQPTGPFSHVCLAGQCICDDARLVAALQRAHQVTLVAELCELWRHPVLGDAAVLVLDNSSRDERMIDALPSLTQEHPRLCVVLVDGGLTQAQVARAFRAGACDYFPSPYDVDLLAERVSSLCRRPPGRLREQT